MFQNVSKDLYRWYGKDRFTIMEYIKAILTPQIKFVIEKRKVEKYRKTNIVRFFYHSVRYRRMKIKLTTDIPAKVEIGDGFVLEHLGGIAINPDVKIGRNVNIYNGVTIGIEKRGKRKGVPKIGNQVWIGANCIIVG